MMDGMKKPELHGAGTRDSGLGTREEPAAHGEAIRGIEMHTTHKLASKRSAGSRVPRPGSRLQRGFTLLEMLAVIVLIGIIGTIVVRQVGHSVDKGKYGAGKAQLTTLGQDIDSYSLDNGSPPQSLDDLVTKPANAANWQGPYAKPSQLKDPWGHAFGYQYPGQHGSYDLIFYGQDGRAGGTGYSADVGNWQ